MEYSLLIVFYYGILHALGPDHLSAITLFSIGKNKKETFFLTLLFAFTHGIILYIFAHIIDYIADDSLLQYGDTISSLVIIGMGMYMVYLAYYNHININTHTHTQEKDKHLHLYYKHTHTHEKHEKKILFSMAVLMGVGGLRGMLITLGVVSHQNIGFEMVLVFVLGVSVVFVVFGYLIYLVNEYIKYSSSLLRYALIATGLLSMGIGGYSLV